VGGNTGNQPRTPAKTRINRRPSQKFGIAMPNRANTRLASSMVLPL